MNRLSLGMRFRIVKFSATILLLLLLVLLQGVVNSKRDYACQTLLFPFCDTALTVEERLNDLISRLDVHEKIEQLSNKASGIPRLGIPNYEWWQEALHGVAISPGVTFAGPIKAATSFPQPILTASSFNDTLFYQIGQVVSTEGRAMYNEGQSGLTFWSPNINIFRDPRWGRGQETPGEDPTLSSNYAVAFVRGMQEGGEADLRSKIDSVSSVPKLKTSTCCKHLAAYDMEKWGDADRDHFDAVVTLQDLEDTFNPPFQSCIQNGRASGLMCSYNRVNGVPSCGSYSLLTSTARDTWGFEGYIVSDCDAVFDMTNYPAYSKTLEDAVADSLLAGMDLNCGETFLYHAGHALSQDLIKESNLDRALNNLFAVQMRLGLYDGDPQSQIYGDLGVGHVCTKENQALALEAALQSIVLLKNDDNVLPLSREGIQSLAVLGPSANDGEYRMLGNYAGIPCTYITPAQGLAKYSKIRYQPGCTDLLCEEKSFIEAELAAAEADAVVIVVGLSQLFEEEGLDRTSLLLPGYQQELISSVAKAAKGPVVLVLMSGGPLDISFAKEDPLISSILWIGYPGQAGGQAIAEIIFGDRNPGGKVPVTWYPESFTRVPMTIMNMRPDSSSGYPGRSYRFYMEEPVFAFGYGLSYTTFLHAFEAVPLVVSTPTLHQQICHEMHSQPNSNLHHCTEEDSSTCSTLSFEVEVLIRNVGQRSGSDVVILYAVPPGSGQNGKPLKSVVRYQRVNLEAGSEALLVFHLDPCKDLSTVKANGERSLDPGEHILSLGNGIEHRVLFVGTQVSASY